MPLNVNKTSLIVLERGKEEFLVRSICPHALDMPGLPQISSLLDGTRVSFPWFNLLIVFQNVKFKDPQKDENSITTRVLCVRPREAFPELSVFSQSPCPSQLTAIPYFMTVFNTRCC